MNWHVIILCKKEHWEQFENKSIAFQAVSFNELPSLIDSVMKDYCYYSVVTCTIL